MSKVTVITFPPGTVSCYGYEKVSTGVRRPANCCPAFGGKVGTTIRSICLIQKLYFQQSLYYKIYDSFPRFLRSKMAGGSERWKTFRGQAKRGTTMVASSNHCTIKHLMSFPRFLRSKMAGRTLGGQEGNYNGCFQQPLYHKTSDGFPPVFAARRTAALLLAARWEPQWLPLATIVP